MILLIGICACTAIFVINLIPGAIDTIVERFQSDDMESGNGQVAKIQLYANVPVFMTLLAYKEISE